MQYDNLPLILVAACVIGVTALAFRYLTGPRAVFLTGSKDYLPIKLVRKVEVSHDTRIFRFALEHPDQILGLPIGQHMSLRATVGNEVVTRSYTPISSDEDRGFVEFVIKVYFGNVHPKFPEGGKMSQHMERLRIGDTIDVRGPTGRFEYTGSGVFKVGGQARKVSKIGLIAGGTGLTPCLQIVRRVLRDPNDKTELWLLFANQTVRDILLRDELEACAKDKRFHLWYTLDTPPESGWPYSSGFVNFDMIRDHMPAASADAVVLMCGPPPMIQYACKPNLEKAGFQATQLFAF